MKRLLLLTALAWASCAMATSVLMEQTVTLKAGWNAFFLAVQPDESADSLFGAWSEDVKQVGMYDQAAFLRTQQFETDPNDTTQGAVENRMKLWVRDTPGLSSLKAPLANAVYLVCITNSNFATTNYTIVGEPRAMRTSWHVCMSTNAPVNYVGISTDGQQAELTQYGYFQGLDTGWTLENSVLSTIIGFKDTPTLKPMAKTPIGGNYSVVAMDAQRVSNWSGVFYVTPETGLDFGTNVAMGVVSVRNDAGTNRMVRIQLSRQEGNLFSALPLPPHVQYFDSARHAEWQSNLTAEGGYERELLAGETLSLRVAVDRTQFASVQAGTEYGGLLSVTDVSTNRPSHFRTIIPFSVTSDGGAFVHTRWPKGLWRATLELDKVSRMIPSGQVERYIDEVKLVTYTNTVVSSENPAITNQVIETHAETNRVPVYATEPLTAGSTMTMRVLVHVDAKGAMRLVQRARIGTRRLSSVVLPANADPEICTGAGTFGGQASFNWTVGERSRVNPFRHARHPDHDGLDAYFEQETPSGDNFNNYLGTVKPELFSIGNALTLKWDAAASATPWNPEETLSGTCAWNFTGLRQEGTILTEGRFSMTRVSALDWSELKEVLK